MVIALVPINVIDLVFRTWRCADEVKCDKPMYFKSLLLSVLHKGNLVITAKDVMLKHDFFAHEKFIVAKKARMMNDLWKPFHVSEVADFIKSFVAFDWQPSLFHFIVFCWHGRPHFCGKSKSAENTLYFTYLYLT